MQPLIHEHLRDCAARGLRPTTLRQRKTILKRVTRQIGVQPIEATPQQLLDWWYDRVNVGIGTRSVELSHVRAFCSWAKKHGYIETDPTALIDMPRRNKRYPRPISEDKLAQALLACGRDDQLRAMLVLGAYAGLRAHEVAYLKWADLHTDCIHVVESKGGKERIVPLHPMVKETLARLPHSTAWMLTRRDGQNKPILPQRVSHIANLHLRELGYADTFHACRHRFGSRLYQQTRDLRFVQDTLGHSSPVTTALYAAWDVNQGLSFVAGL